MISWMGTAAEVGIYAVAFRITNYFAMFRSQVSTAFFPMFVKHFEKKSIKLNLLLKSLFILFIIGLAGAIVISFLSEPMIILLFGEEFRSSGKILSILIFYIAIGYATIPISNILLATDQEKFVIILNIVSSISNIGFNYIFYQRYGVVGIAYSTLLIKSIITPINVIFIIFTLKRKNLLTK